MLLKYLQVTSGNSGHIARTDLEAAQQGQRPKSELFASFVNQKILHRFIRNHLNFIFKLNQPAHSNNSDRSSYRLIPELENTLSAAMTRNHNLHCPVCKGTCFLLDVVDFNKSCEEARGKFLGLAGIPIYYALCSNCRFCFAPELLNWQLEEFEQRIYNDEYILVDPDYIETRPRSNAANLISMFGDHALSIKHLDYGGGSGLLAKLLRESKWQSTSYDPFVNRDVSIGQLGKFDLITAFEVFEHVPDVRQLMSSLSSLLSTNGLVLFSTLLTDENIHPNQRVNWWYASPRNGHISLFSKHSLAIMAQDYGFNFGSFSEGFHVFFKKVPHWADHIIKIS